MIDAGHHAAQKNSYLVSKVRSILVFIALVIGLTYVASEYVIDAYAVPSGSMESTIHTGDRVYVEHVSYYFRDVEPGDIITFDDPEIPGRVLLKRCIAIEGQTINLKEGIVYVDEEALSEPYVEEKKTESFSRTKAEIVYPYTIPEGSIWVMGDNRTNSQDSRYFGPIDASTIRERVFIVVWPIDHAGIVE